MDNDRVITNQYQIENCCIDHYAKVWNYVSNCCVEDICSAIPNDLRTINRNDIDLLIKLVTIAEVYHTLRTTPKAKSPRAKWS